MISTIISCINLPLYNTIPLVRSRGHNSFMVLVSFKQTKIWKQRNNPRTCTKSCATTRLLLQQNKLLCDSILTKASDGLV